MSSLTFCSTTLPFLIPGGCVIPNLPRSRCWWPPSRFFRVAVLRFSWRRPRPGRPFWPKPPKTANCCPWRTWRPPHRSPCACIASKLLRLHVAFVADHHKAHLGVAVDFGLLEPARDVGEGFAVGDVVDEDSAGGRAVVSPGYRFEGFLSGLGA